MGSEMCIRDRVIPVGLHGCQAQQELSPRRSDVEMNRTAGIVEQGLRGRELQGQLEEPTEGIDVLAQGQAVGGGPASDIARGAWRSSPQEAV